jgi:electron transfer flavoprotein alpha subunit
MTTGEIWIYGDIRTARHWQDSLKVMAKVRPLARAAKAPLVMLLLGAKDHTPDQSDGIDLTACIPPEKAAADAQKYGVHRIRHLTHPNLAVPRPDSYALTLSAHAQQLQPWLVLFSLNDFGRETAAFCAQHCQAGMIADCTDLQLQDSQIVGRCPAWGGQILADITLAAGWPTAFVTVQPHGGTFEEKTDVSPISVEEIPLEQATVPQGLELRRRSLESVETRRLEDADIVVVGGAGVGDMRGFGQVRELAAALGGEVGATRPPVLYHWVAAERLIGQTGKTVRPRLLVSVGTSGAIQYTAGITDAQTIVAINRDPKAPIFQWADIGIIADAGTFLPLFTQRAKQGALRRLADAACTLNENPAVARGGFGALIRQMREARDWTAEQLAQATGQTPDFIGQVENEQLSPPVSFILSMAQTLQVDPGTFLRKGEQTAIRDLRAQAYHRRTQDYNYTTLTPEAENSHLRAFMITIEPHHAHKPVAYKHEGEEFIYVMEGALEFTLGTKAHALQPGESIHFNSDVPHKLKSLSSKPTRCLVVLYTI